MKKIDILNFITNFRKTPNEVKSYKAIIEHLGESNEPQIVQFLYELEQTNVIKETTLEGEKAYRVVAR